MLKKILVLMFVALFFSSISFGELINMEGEWVSRNFIRESVKKNIVTQNSSISNFTTDELIIDNDEEITVVLLNSVVKHLIHSGKGKLKLLIDKKSLVHVAELDSENYVENASRIKKLIVKSNRTMLDGEVEHLTFANDAEYVTFFERPKDKQVNKRSNNIGIMRKFVEVKVTSVEDEGDKSLDDMEELTPQVSSKSESEVSSNSETIKESIPMVLEANVESTIDQYGEFDISINADDVGVFKGILNVETTQDVTPDYIDQLITLYPDQSITMTISPGKNIGTIYGLSPGKSYEVIGYLKTEVGCSPPCKLSFTAKDYDLGEGSETNPYKIYRVDELLNIGTKWSLNACYELMNDIDIKDEFYYLNNDVVTNWSPIASIDQPFSGTIDGKGYSISNIEINKLGKDAVGFIASSKRAVIKNIGLKGVDIKGRDKVGALIGVSDNSQLTNIFISGDIQGRDSVGGLCGESLNNSSFTNILAMLSVFGNDYVAGGVGRGKAVINFGYLDLLVESQNKAAGVVSCLEGSISGITVKLSITGNSVKRIADNNEIKPFLMLNYALNDCIMPEDWIGTKGPYAVDGQDLEKIEFESMNSICFLRWDFDSDLKGDNSYYTNDGHFLTLWYTDGIFSRPIGKISLD